MTLRDVDKEAYLDAMASTGLSVAMTTTNGSPSMSMRRGGMGGGRSAEDRQEQLRNLEWPETLPSIRTGSARVDPAGRLWIERYGNAGDSVSYDIFDRAGARAATARLPAGRRVIGFDGDRVLAVHVDELGLNWLEAYRTAPRR